MNQNKWTHLLLFLISFFMIFGSSRTFAAKKSSQVLYLQNNIHAQAKADRGGKTISRASYANYIDSGEGHYIVPVNTRVTLKVKGGFRGKSIIITRVKDKKVIHMEFNKTNMDMDIKQYMKIIAKPRKVSFKGLSKIDRKGIRNGKAYKGMSKQGVRIALGYPAKHMTPSLKSNEWTYWRNRFMTRVVVFSSKGRVRAIR